MSKLLEGFAEYAKQDPVYSTISHSVIGCQPGTRLYRIIRLPYGWRIWTATRDFSSVGHTPNYMTMDKQ